MTPPYGVIFCSETGHIETSECGAAQLFTGGAKLTLIRHKSGKMDVDALDEAIRTSGKGMQHRSQAAVVNLTIATERGTVYPTRELERIAEVTKRHGLKFHMDGARMANALVALGASAADVTTRLGVDVLSFGATKNGALNAEAIVAFRKDIADELRYRVRRSGQVWSKMRYASAQLRSYVEGGLWLRLAAQANRAGKRLSEGLVQVPGVRMMEPVEINQLFVEMPERVIAGLETDGIGLGRRDGGVRMVTAGCTSDAEVDHVIARAKVHGARAAA